MSDSGTKAPSGEQTGAQSGEQSQAQQQRVVDFFVRRRTRLGSFVDALRAADQSAVPADTDRVIAEAEVVFRDMTRDMAYVDAPQLVMSQALFFCMVQLAVYQVLCKQIDVHVYGAAMLDFMRHSADADEMDDEADEAETVLGPGPGTHPGEFVLEVVNAEGESFDSGYNIKSCAICYHFARYDAMALVPYMCASDDVISDKGQQGLRRTGTIALGAQQCDFRYTRGGEPRRVAEHFPEQIRFVH
ncbi:MAG: L-2-amino-thiazoline-4-carboxylic acid hydrolase [Pseudomonadota bacterium]